jgi:hypothetical protein
MGACVGAAVACFGWLLKTTGVIVSILPLTWNQCWNLECRWNFSFCRIPALIERIGLVINFSIVVSQRQEEEGCQTASQ